MSEHISIIIYFKNKTKIMLTLKNKQLDIFKSQFNNESEFVVFNNFIIRKDEVLYVCEK